MSKKNFLVIMALVLFTFAVVLSGCGAGTSSKPFPQRDITMVVPFGTGGGTDQVARVLGDLIDKAVPPAVIVVNKTGGAGALGLTEVSKAQPDGHNLVLMTSNISTLVWTGHTKLTYKDFEPVAAVNYDAPALIVKNDSPWKTYADFANDAKTRTLKVATGAPGGLWQVGAIALMKRQELKLNIIPSDTGGAPAAIKLLGGHVDAIVVPPNEASNQIIAKQFRVIGIMAPDRNPLSPETLTFKEMGIDLDIRSVRGFLVPKGTPVETIKTLEGLFKSAYDNKGYQEYMKKTGSNVVWMGTKDYTAYLSTELNKYESLLKETGVTKK